jgi:hypothetical protein
MAEVTWSTPGTISSSLVTTELDSLANLSESALFTYDNSSDKKLYGLVTITLGSIDATTASSLILRVIAADGTNTPDKAGGDKYPVEVLTGTSAKAVTIPMVRLYPFSLRFSITNNTGVTLNAADNDVYIRTYGENV